MTAVQMVIDAFYKYRYDNPHLIELFNVAIDKEKQQIKDAYNQGYRDGLEDWNCEQLRDVAECCNAEYYYKQTFNK
jgi:hypothetical protein